MRKTWRELETYLRGFMAMLAAQPRTILAISGHWEEDVPTVNAGKHASLLFDYGSFPDHTHRLTWPAPGQPLRDQGVLILGSGLTYQSTRGSFGGGAADSKAEAFDAWLRSAVIDGNTRDGALTRWENAPHARGAQPHEDHLLPLMVATGAASGEPVIVHFNGHALGKPISGFRFG